MAGEGHAINLYNVGAGGIQNAPIKGQCARDYFYGRDGEIEHLLQEIEGRYATVVAKITAAPATVTEDDLLVLSVFAHLQMNRTEGAVKKREQNIQNMDALAHRGFEHMRRETPDTSHSAMVHGALRTWVSSRYTIEDLRVVLLRNETPRDFVTSDDPAILVNRLYSHRLRGRAFGLVSPGVQLILPLAPKMALICYDKDTYTAPNRQGFWISITKNTDVEALNELQYISCVANIYFSNWADLGAITPEFAAAVPRRPTEWFRHWVAIQVGEDEEWEYYRPATEDEAASARTRLIQTSFVFPKPSQWLGELAYRPKVTGWSNGSAAGWVREGQRARFNAGGTSMRKGEVRFEAKYLPDNPRRIITLRKSDVA